MSESTKLSRQLSDCLARAGAPLSEDQYMLVTGYLIQSGIEKQEMARCLNECLNQVNEAITATMRAGNRGALTVNGQKLTTGEVSERLDGLRRQRDRIQKALHPQRTTNRLPEEIK